MPDRSKKQTKQEKLAQADRHIAAAESLIAQQTSLLADLEREGHDTETARSLLDNMHQSLEQMCAHRAIIETEPES
jgi:hypothetical protein